MSDEEEKMRTAYLFGSDILCVYRSGMLGRVVLAVGGNGVNIRYEEVRELIEILQGFVRDIDREKTEEGNPCLMSA